MPPTELVGGIEDGVWREIHTFQLGQGTIYPTWRTHHVLSNPPLTMAAVFAAPRVS